MVTTRVGPRSGPRTGPTIAGLLRDYATGAGTPVATIHRVAAEIRAAGEDGTWIATVPEDELVARAQELEDRPGAKALPLYGIPFAVKDNIDVAGLPTTVACPDFAYLPDWTAPVIARLLEAGALVVGKTNLDQFATGLNGTRTPYAIPTSVFGQRLISGGSSSGSALAVAKGQVPFAVATDTAGSGRVPAALNGILGYKPSRGLVSTVGLVPACRSLDCMSLMATTTSDLRRVLDVVAALDIGDPWSRARPAQPEPVPPAVSLRVGLPAPSDLEFFGDEGMRRAHAAARGRVGRLFPASVPADIGPFHDAGALLYQGAWVAERLVELDGFLREHPSSVLPVIRAILEGGRRYTAIDAFRAQQRLQELRAVVDRSWTQMDVLVVPTIGTTFTVEQVLADPVDCNTALGRYTHFANLLDLVAVAVPAGTTADGRPASLMVLGPALADDLVLSVAARLAGETDPTDSMDPAGRTGAADSAHASAPAPARTSAPASAPDPVEARTPFVVVGHHLSGGPRNQELTDRGGVLRETTTTSARYRLLRVGTIEPVPALLRTSGPGCAIEVEVWSVPCDVLPDLLGGVSPVLDLGRVQLRDGRELLGFVCGGPVAGGDTALAVEDISSAGGWRAHLAARSVASAEASPSLLF